MQHQMPFLPHPQPLSLYPLKDKLFPLISAGLQISTASNKHHTFGYPHRNNRLPSNKCRTYKCVIY